MPAPATVMPNGTSHGIARRSVSTPNNGCTTEDSTVAATVMPAAAR